MHKDKILALERFWPHCLQASVTHLSQRILLVRCFELKQVKLVGLKIDVYCKFTKCMLSTVRIMHPFSVSINFLHNSYHCRLLVPGNTRKIPTEIWHHFGLKNDGEKWSRKNYFEIPWWPSEIPANLPGQFSLSWQIFLHWAAATLKAIVEF